LDEGCFTTGPVVLAINQTRLLEDRDEVQKVAVYIPNCKNACRRPARYVGLAPTQFAREQKHKETSACTKVSHADWSPSHFRAPYGTNFRCNFVYSDLA
jgi:hypothetical protein